MNLTKKQAIYEHRKMWNWIADETLKRKEKVTKEDYFEEHKEEYPEVPVCNCWCCGYNKGGCSKCPVVWDSTNVLRDCDDNSSYHKWCNCLGDNETDYVKAAEYARKIAELPERGRLKI